MQRLFLSAARLRRAGAGPRRGSRAGRATRPSPSYSSCHTAGGTTDLVAHRGPEGRGETGPARHRREPSARAAISAWMPCRRPTATPSASAPFPPMRSIPSSIRRCHSIRPDFTGISMLGASSVVLETGPSIKVDSVKDLVAYASSIRHRVRHAGNGHVDASGGRDVRPADRRRHAAHSLQGQRARHQRSAGRPSAHHVRQPAGSLPHKSGKVRALAVTGSSARRRCRTPTLAELGGGAAVVDPWFAVMVPPRCRRRSPRP